jgi:hypothetical protein
LTSAEHPSLRLFFQGPSLAAHTVIVRLDRTIQYSETVMIESIGRGVLDRPLSRAMTAEYVVQA